MERSRLLLLSDASNLDHSHFLHALVTSLDASSSHDARGAQCDNGRTDLQVPIVCEGTRLNGPLCRAVDTGLSLRTMVETIPHVSICICTFKRPDMLGRLLKALDQQQTKSLFAYSVTIVDNDVSQSAREVVLDFQNASSLCITYCVEPEQNIALARNRALANTTGDFIAFIDDDELPVSNWLLELIQTCQKHSADGVLGPVLARFEGSPPAWVKKGGFCERRFSHPSGFRIDWTEGRTGNLLLKREILNGIEPVFRPEFGSGGEDRNFFRRMIQDGRQFIWCNEAVAYESVPPIRWKRSFMIRRALLRGKMSLHHRRGVGDLAKSLFAVVAYTITLPVLFLVGHHLFMKYLIKICDHVGKLLAFVGLDPIRERYVLE